MIFRTLQLLTLFFCLQGSLWAQQWPFYRNEIFMGIGASNFLGELGGADNIGTNGIRDLEFTMTRPTVVAGYRFSINPYLAVRGVFTQGFVKGNDALTNEIYRNNRNLNFRSPITEITACIEFYPIRERFEHLYRMRGARGRRMNYLSPYVTSGIGAFYFNPKGRYQGKWYKLKPLRTEGQGLAGGPAPYKRFSICIPIGIGAKYSLDRNWSIGFEINGRKTFTDYIDDVSTVYYDPVALSQIDPMTPLLADPSLGIIPTATMPNADGSGAQRGDSADKDAYMFAIFSVHYRFHKYHAHLPKF